MYSIILQHSTVTVIFLSLGINIKKINKLFNWEAFFKFLAIPAQLDSVSQEGDYEIRIL